MLAVEGLRLSFRDLPVLCGVNLEIAAGEMVGLVGRSGSGKSTLARSLVGLDRADAGQIRLGGEFIEPGQGSARRQIQYLWQDPSQSLSPFLTAKSAVLETLNGFDIGAAQFRVNRAEELLENLGLERAAWNRRPHALSGGQCQRVAMARALAAQSKVLILDEPLSSLDLITQISTMELLGKVHSERKTAMLIVSHDLAPLRRFADRIAVLDQGRIVDDLPVQNMSSKDAHPLLQAYMDVLSDPME